MKTDVAIIGGGPGGAAASMYLARKGIRSTIIEKTKFPRYHIGESMTGELGGLLRDLGLEDKMIAQKHPVKLGVRVYGPGGKGSFWVPVMARSPEGKLVNQTTWQVRRSVFDEMMLAEAASRGANVILAEALEPIRDGDRVCGVRVRTPEGRLAKVDSKVLVDATGHGTFLARSGLTSAKDRGRYDKQVAIFSQVAGAIRDPAPHDGNALIFYQKKFHWAWFIPLDQETVSVGVVTPVDYYKSRNESKQDFLVRELRELNGELSRRLPKIDLTEETRGIPNYSYEVKEFSGKGWLCLGDAHRFIDPIFSFGLYFSIKEASFAAPAIADYLGGATANDENPFAEFQQLATSGMDVIQDMMDAFWEEPFAFALIVHQKHPEDIIDIFAGRLYEGQPSRGLKAIQAVNEYARKKAMACAM
jgi:flavin-dependent dehydrogenase